MSLRVVRAFGSGKCHVADVADTDLMEVTSFGSTGQAVGLDPVATVCTARLRGVVVVMRDASVDCRPCARLSGVTELRAALDRLDKETP